MWINSESIKVGRGKYTENGPNRKFCGWTKEGMRRFNKLLEEVRGNRNKQYSDEVEDVTLKVLAERHSALMRGSCKNSRKHRRHFTEFSNLSEDEEDDDDTSVVPEDDLILLATQLTQV